MDQQDLKVLFIIINAGHADEVMEVARSAGAKGGTILNARGEGALHEVFMGITVDSEKEIIMCIMEEGTANNVMAAIKEQAGIKTPAHGVCFTLPVDGIVGINTPASKLDDR